MRIWAPLTDYIPKSILTTKGDLPVRGTTIPERLAAAADGTFFRGKGAGAIPAYEVLDGVSGKILTAKGAGVKAAFEYLDGAAFHYLKGQGAGAAYTFSALTLRDVGVFIGSGTRNSSGPEVITGVGFRPSIVLFAAVCTTGTVASFSIGWDNSTVHMCIYMDLGDTYNNYHTSRAIYIRNTSSHIISGYVSAVGADGFTITFNLTGTTGCEYTYLALP